MSHITGFAVVDCRNIEHLEVRIPDGTDERPFRHVILTGPNGSGKSGVLEALAATLGEDFALERKRVWYERRSEFAGNDLGDPGPDCAVCWGDASIVSGFAWRQAKESGESVFVHRTAFRKPGMREPRGPERLELPTTQGHAQALSAGFLQFLVNRKTEQAFALSDGDEATAAALGAWFEELERRFAELMETPGLRLDFDRQAFRFSFLTPAGFRFGFDTLADGFAAAVDIVAELMLRTEAARRERGDATWEPDGIVLVDEIETHLHLSLQEKILPFLTTLFPRLQFIVASHSPAVIASVEGAFVYDLARREGYLTDSLRGVRYGTIMTSHFGIESDLDLDSTAKLRRLRELANLGAPSVELREEIEALAAELSERSETLGLEVWHTLEGRRALGREPMDD